MLPDSTLKVLDGIASKGERSRFISEAVLYFVRAHSVQTLRDKLRVGYQSNAERNLKLAADWFPIDNDIWQNQKSKNKRKSK